MAGTADIQQRRLFKFGIGNWSAYWRAGFSIEQLLTAATRWRALLSGIDYPWLCWNVDDDWCYVQQRLVEWAGWTPVVGFDPRVGPPAKRVPNAVVIDFNREFGLPTMFFHFPLEFAFVFADRLAFWHSDLLLAPKKMEALASRFRALEAGEISVTGSRFSLGDVLKPRERRYWELIGCTTREASRDQFEKGCGWWMNFDQHPNCPSAAERTRRQAWYWDHGTGIRYWSRRYGRPVQLVRERYVREGHCTQIKNNDYQRISPNDEKRNLSLDIKHNFELENVCHRLGLGTVLSDRTNA